MAALQVDKDGNTYYLGIGGARIPVGPQMQSILENSEVGPDDSASQMGGRVMRVQGMGTSRFGGPNDRRAEGFW